MKGKMIGTNQQQEYTNGKVNLKILTISKEVVTSLIVLMVFEVCDLLFNLTRQG